VLSGYYLEGSDVDSVGLLKEINFVFYSPRPARESQLRYYEVFLVFFIARSAVNRVESNHGKGFLDIQEQSLKIIVFIKLEFQNNIDKIDRSTEGP
jgi:hypothetical protein